MSFGGRNNQNNLFFRSLNRNFAALLQKLMKILHTSDWHLGHTLYNYDRTEEQRAMLEQMVSIVEEQKPDVFLLCGDFITRHSHRLQYKPCCRTDLSESMRLTLR